MRISRVLQAAILVSLFSVYAVAAQATEGAVSVKSEAFVQVEVKGEDGKVRLERKPPVKAIPGTVVEFVNTYTNISKKPVNGIVVNNPVPAHTEYQAGSAYGSDTEITFSVDGGKTFATAENLKIKAADGAEQIAKPSTYTHIHWVYKKPLAVSQAAEVGFRAMIK
jgi:uncharacterized repeat protein (TIGR01451 family)